MYEENQILRKIEQWVDKLPYRSVKIEVALPDKTLVLTKDLAFLCWGGIMVCILPPKGVHEI